MRVYKKSNILAAFTTVKRLARAGQPVIQKDLPLSNESMRWFKEALTHNFNIKEHGFTLQPIFKIEGNKWTELENTPLNPKDDSLIDVIIKAMTYTRKAKLKAKEIEKATFNPIQSNPRTQLDVSDEYLIENLKIRGYIVLKMM
jgi:hypothetical protein